MTSKFKNRLLKLALLAFSTLLSLVLLEFAVRTLFPFYNPQGPQQIVFRFNAEGVPLGPANQTIRQRQPAGDYDVEVAFNSLGMRDSKDLRSATSGDWFAVGDSMGLGWGLAENKRFSNVLQDLAHIKVFNLCVPTDLAGYIQLVHYAEQRSGVAIKNLVVSVTMENDLRDYYRNDPEKADYRLVPLAKLSLKERARDFLKRNSAVYLLMSTELQQTEALHKFWQAIGVARKEDADELLFKNNYDEPAIENAVKLLEQLATGRSRVVVLIIPSRALWIGKNREVEAKVHDLFVREVGKNRAIELIDMRPVFEATQDPRQFHFKHDGHWNETGHAKAARYLADRILSGTRSDAGSVSAGPLAPSPPPAAALPATH